MTPIAPHITAFLRERLPVERRASEHTCDAYAHAFRLLFEYAASQLKTTPSKLQLEQIDAPLVLRFLAFIETERGNRPTTRNSRLAAIKSFMHYDALSNSCASGVQNTVGTGTGASDSRHTEQENRDKIGVSSHAGRSASHS